MRDTEKFFRDAHSDATTALQRIRERPGAASVLLDADDIEAGLKALDLAIDILAEHDKQAKARRDRIQWIQTCLGTYVARVGRTTYEFSPARKMVSRLDEGRTVRISGSSKVTSTESASRIIRRLRGAKK